MSGEWSTGDLIASWTLVGDDWQLVGNKTGATRLGFSLLLKLFEIEARFPRGAAEFPAAAVAYVAEQVSSPAPSSRRTMVLTGIHDEHDGGVVGEDDWRGLVFTLTP